MGGDATSGRTLEVFFSYSHKDQRMRDKLEEHLSSLKRSRHISGWHDRKIMPGTEWRGQIDSHIGRADIILLLVSSAFMDSGFCWEVELTRAIARHDAGDARVIPIILRPCDWKLAPFGKLQALPRRGIPVSNFATHDDGYNEVAQDIRWVVEEMSRGGRSGGDVPPAPEPPDIEIGRTQPPPKLKRTHPDFRGAPGDAPAADPPRGVDGGPYSLTILCDFDGTMTESDTTDDILVRCAHPMWEAIEDAWDIYQAIYSRECMRFQSMCIPVDERVRGKMDDYLDTEVKLDPGFRRFEEECRRLRVELIVNSDGFDYAIKKVLRRHDIDWLEVYSNELRMFDRSHFLDFPNGHPNCWDRFSEDTQGTCKCKLVSRAVADRRGVILIGNDRTDRCAVRYAAEVFACKKRKERRGEKNALVQRCHDLGTKCTPFKGFDEITPRLEGLIAAYGEHTPKEKLEPWMMENS